MSFPEDDSYWLNIVEFIRVNCRDRDKILAPSVFKEKLNNVYAYSHAESATIKDFSWIIIHKDQIKELNLGQILSLQTIKRKCYLHQM